MQNLDVASQSYYLWKAVVGKCEEKRLSNCAVLCCEDLGLNSERLGGSLLEGDPRVVHQHVDPSVSEAGLVVQGGAILV